MVRGRIGSSSSSSSRNSARYKYLLKPSSLNSSITCVVLGFFIITIFFFVCTSKYDDEPSKSFLPHEEESLQQQTPGDRLWEAPYSYGFHPCIKPTPRYKSTEGSNRYITVKSNGGLNQMRTGIADMVAVARIMNATLVIPQLDRKSFWQDSSTFSDIFDELHFIAILQEDVKIVGELPKELELVPRARKHFTSWGSMGYYEEMRGLWKDYQVLHVAKSDSRLANNDLPLDVQRLRCRVLYNALRFSPPIENLAKGILLN